MKWTIVMLMLILTGCHNPTQEERYEDKLYSIRFTHEFEVKQGETAYKLGISPESNPYQGKSYY